MRWIPSVLLLVLAGCQGALNDQRSVTVKQGEYKSVLFEVQKFSKKVQVEVKSPGTPLDCYLVLEKDRVALLELLERSKKPENMLAQSIQAEEATLEGNIPAHNAFALVLSTRASKDTTVSIKTTQVR